MLQRLSMIFFVFAAMVLSHPAGALACSVCFGAAGDDAAGYNASVLFLMATPYLVFGTIIGGLIFTYRRALKRRERPDAAEPEVQFPWKQEESGR
jgi:hypothetical protein